MRYYVVTVIVRDDGITGGPDAIYFDKSEVMRELDPRDLPAGLDAQVVSVMECATDTVTLWNNQAEDKGCVEFANRMEREGKGRVSHGLSARVIQLSEIFKNVNESTI